MIVILFLLKFWIRYLVYTIFGRIKPIFRIIMKIFKFHFFVILKLKKS